MIEQPVGTMAAKCHRVVWGRRTTACTSVFQTTLSPRGNSPELVNTTVEWKFDGFYGEYRWRRHVFAPLPNQITPTRMFHSCFYLNIVKGKGSQQIFYIFERSLHKSTHTRRHGIQAAFIIITKRWSNLSEDFTPFPKESSFVMQPVIHKI